VVLLRPPGREPGVGRSVGMGAALGPWLEWRFGWKPRLVEDAALAASHEGRITTYELWLSRRRFADGMPRGFDIRLHAGDGRGNGAVLEWGGALANPELFPPTPFKDRT
jgi:hypothetical protein